MGDTVVTILAIVLAAVLMFIFPLMSVADRSDDVSQLSVQNSTTTFVDNIRSTGRITLADYSKFAQEINATGNTYDIEMEVKVLDENPGKKTAQTAYEKIGENVYYTEYTTQIMEDLNDASNNNTKYLKEGDIVSVSVKNTNTTISQLLRNFFYRVTGNDSSTIGASNGGIVTVNGRN